MNTMCFVPFAWGTELEIFEYERHLINALQAPMQDRVKKGSYRVARPRLWPRFRKKPDINKELDLNQCGFLRNLGKKRIMLTGCKFRIQNFSQLCLWLKATEGLEPEQIKKQVYRCDRVFWLALLLADPQERLNYRKVWKAGALQLMLGVWNCSRILPRKSAMAIQKRVDRFFNMSGLMRTHSFTVRVASLSENAVSQTKKKVARIINSTRRCNSWLADYLQEKIKVCKVKSWSLAQSFDSHIKTAKETDVFAFLRDNIENNRGLESWQKREDCVCSSVHWDVPMETRNVELVGSITRQPRSQSCEGKFAGSILWGHRAITADDEFSRAILQ